MADFAHLEIDVDSEFRWLDVFYEPKQTVLVEQAPRGLVHCDRYVEVLRKEFEFRLLLRGDALIGSDCINL